MEKITVYVYYVEVMMKHHNISYYTVQPYRIFEIRLLMRS